jgi:hypothetical protein
MNISTKLAIFLVIAGLAAGIFNVTNMAFAEKPESEQDGWGEVTSELATSEQGEDEEDDEPGGLVGEHSRANGDFPDSEPPFDGEDGEGDKGRSGLGNVARDLGFESIHDLGCALAGIDENEATDC